MSALAASRDRYAALIRAVSGRLPEAAALLLARLALGGVFWRSGQTKVEEGTWFSLTESTYELFRSEYAGVPLPPELGAVLANAAEHILPVLLVLGLCTRLSALGLLGMTMVIQVFVYPDAWWPEHALWTALALILIVRGGGLLSLDAALTVRSRR